MDQNQLFERITDVFQDVFEDDELTITRETTADDVEGWDSFRHVVLIVSVEKSFGIKLQSSEVFGLKNVGELIDLVASKTSV